MLFLLKYISNLDIEVSPSFTSFSLIQFTSVSSWLFVVWSHYSLNEYITWTRYSKHPFTTFICKLHNIPFFTTKSLSTLANFPKNLLLVFSQYTIRIDCSYYSRCQAVLPSAYSKLGLLFRTEHLTMVFWTV